MSRTHANMAELFYAQHGRHAQHGQHSTPGMYSTSYRFCVALTNHDDVVTPGATGSAVLCKKHEICVVLRVGVAEEIDDQIPVWLERRIPRQSVIDVQNDSCIGMCV